MGLVIRFEPSLKTLFNRFKEKVKNYFKKWNKKSELEEAKKLIEEENLKLLYADFEKKYHISPNRIKDIMRRVDNVNSQIHKRMPDDEYEAFRETQRLDSIALAAKAKATSLGSAFYEPEIIDIHNESLEDIVGPSLQQLKEAESSHSRRMLMEQKMKNSPISTRTPIESGLSPEERGCLEKQRKEAYHSSIDDIKERAKEIFINAKKYM